MFISRVVASSTLVRAAARSGAAKRYLSSAVPKTWGHPAEGPTFNPEYPTEFRTSQIEGAGNGWWAKADIPAGVRLRRVTVADGTLLKFSSWVGRPFLHSFLRLCSRSNCISSCSVPSTTADAGCSVGGDADATR